MTLLNLAPLHHFHLLICPNFISKFSLKQCTQNMFIYSIKITESWYYIPVIKSFNKFIIAGVFVYCTPLLLIFIDR